VLTNMLTPLLPLQTVCVEVISLVSSTPFKLLSMPEVSTAPPFGQVVLAAAAAILYTALGALLAAVLAVLDPPPPQAASKAERVTERT
jgi:hypothetical protein